jgi:ribonucleoside-diphosphate reductase alpha chain
MGVASGPVSFMNIVNQVTDVVKQGGVRRGANMGMMRVTHPDVLRFIHAKNDQHSLTNFNISVNVTDKFLKAVDNKEWFQSEFNGEPWNESIFDPVRDGDYVLYRRAGVSGGRFFQVHDRGTASTRNDLRSRHLESNHSQCAQVR